MMQTVSTLQVDKSRIHIDRLEGLRYVGYRRGAAYDENLEKRADEIAGKVENCMVPRVCYLEAPVWKKDDETIDFGYFTLKSKSLIKNLEGCCKAYLFAATLGPTVDREIARAMQKSSVDSLLFDAMGSAGIEAVCNEACAKFAEWEPDKKLHPRFSPGYGGLSIESQRLFVQVLDTNRKIGLTLTEGLMMTPVKSVTAIAGVGEKTDVAPEGGQTPCQLCGKTDCLFRQTKGKEA